MTKNEENQSQLFRMLILFFSENTTIISSTIDLVNAIALLNTYSNDIMIIHSRCSNRGAYSTNAKQIRKKALTDVLLYYQPRIKLWLHTANDPDAPMETRITPSDIKYAPTDKLLIIAQKVYEYADANLVALGAYGIDAAKQTQLQQAQDAFFSISDSPKREAANRKEDNKLLSEIIQKGRKLVRDDITMLMRLYEFTHYEFYLQFTYAAKLGKPGTRVMALRIRVQNAAKQPISGCKVVVLSAKRGSKPIEKTTKISGVLPYQHMPKGRCTITATMPDGAVQTQEVNIKTSERQDVVFVF